MKFVSGFFSPNVITGTKNLWKNAGSGFGWDGINFLPSSWYTVHPTAWELVYWW